MWVPEWVWQARARGHDLARPPGALPNLLCAKGLGLVPGEEPGRQGGGGGAGEDFRAILTRGPGLSLPGEIGGHRGIKPVSNDYPFPASGNVGDLQLSSQGISCEVGTVRNSVCT